MQNQRRQLCINWSKPSFQLLVDACAFMTAAVAQPRVKPLALSRSISPAGSSYHDQPVVYQSSLLWSQHDRGQVTLLLDSEIWLHLGTISTASPDLLGWLASATLSHGKEWNTVYLWRRSNVRGVKQLRYLK